MIIFLSKTRHTHIMNIVSITLIIFGEKQAPVTLLKAMRTRFILTLQNKQSENCIHRFL
jgi:hypothetical protein